MPLLVRMLASLFVAGVLSAQAGAWATIPGDPGRIETNAGRMAFDRDRGRSVLVFGSDIWEAAGSSWRRVASGPGIGGVGGAFAYDWGRGTSIWFGGGSIFNYLNSTFEWDGASWTPIVTANAPSPRQTAMVYDVARSRMVLFGGFGVGGALSDTWEFDGVDWVQRFPATNPPALLEVRMAYDLVRSETVLFGMLGGVAQTWLFDGVDWRQGPNGPSAATLPAMVYDEARDRTVLASGGSILGSAISTWEWDGSSWSVAQTNGPELLHSVHGVYDSVRGLPLIVASEAGLGIGTWRWDGSTWLPATPFGIAPVLQGVAAAYHRSSRTVVAFGGSYAFFFPSDRTHAYAGGTWSRLQPATTPAGRGGAAMATEPSGDVVMFGGRGLSVFDETWRWDGVDWAQLAPASRPSPRYGHRMATDLARNRVVLFGGEDAAGNLLGDTWEWDGVTWQQRTSPLSPSPRTQPAMAFDAARNVTVLFGGGSQFSPIVGDHWEWDGNVWVPRTPPTLPAPRADAQLTFDPAVGELVLAGGFETLIGGMLPVADSWTWDGAVWTPVTGSAPAYGVTAIGVYHEELRATVHATGAADAEFAFGSVASVGSFGVGCPGAAGPLELSTLSVPRTGNTQFSLWLGNGLGGAVGAIGLDASSTSIPLGGGCEALLPAPILLPVVCDPIGNARQALPIPNLPALHGQRLFCQAIALDPIGALGGFAAMSAGLQLVLSS